ncbi:MMPL family transporter [Streptomyces clavuligerus]|uniref:Putative transmembrane transport protein n=1 Tax=Streptomyces clavuligerus TaxID=1901 RepID=B5GPX3_STRCL|nr:MMPL family transporter [Streptomyces clavuligerus]EDY48369.1 transmembrane transport protein [Streptomyces clavuligerus]EFG07374.1 Putative transmembrane transport protein [Streptomyces clavuligerus]MBY6304397.1 MMPL family transporter [Streptomyces clavuligerus]QCS07164.1 MMPL family transporter [Streptomyces clavuligerus]QPJ93484.1 MMPL family transporter [Streptomyces clavuligerus]
MATFLYKLGRISFRRRWLVLLTWVALLLLAGVGASTAAKAKDPGFALPGTESQQAFDLMEERFPGAQADGAVGRMVFKAPDGQKVTAADNKAQITKTVEELKSGSKQVADAADPFTTGAVSKDGSTAYVTVSYKANAMELTDDSREALKEAGEKARASGMQVEIGGDAAMAEMDPSSAEMIGIGIAAVVLVITFGSMVAAGLPLLTAIIGVGIGISSITALANVLDLGTTTGTLATMIGLAVGIDYALFIVSRYRAEVAEGYSREEAIGRATGTAGSAVVFAGLTVVIALCGLAVVNIPILTKMGFAAAATVVIAVVIALTLIPALLGFAGKMAFSRKTRKAMKAGIEPAAAAAQAANGKPNGGTRWARFVLRRPVAVLVAAVVGLGVVALPVSSLQLGLPDEGASAPSSSPRKAYDLLSEGFGPGFNGPLMTVTDLKGSEDPKAAADEIAERLGKLDNVAFVAPGPLNKAGDASIITVIPKDRPAAPATEDLVHDIRAAGSSIKADTGASILVTGTPALNIDFSQKMNDALVPYLALVVGLAFLLLVLVFRSILVPLKAALGFLLSVLAALGAVVAVYQWGWLADLFSVEQPGPIMSMMPIFMVGVVFGLAMDYEVFLVTRMREAFVHGERPGDAVVTGFNHGARVVTAAAVIMIGVFSGFIFSGDQMVTMMGFGLAIAVLFDAFVVRMAIVPAVLALLGEKAWWLPSWLDRVLPNVDVEGEKLSKQLADAPEDPDGERRLVGV